MVKTPNEKKEISIFFELFLINVEHCKKFTNGKVKRSCMYLYKKLG